MCRTGGRRCSGSSGKAKATLRQRIHRARRAVGTASAAGDTAAVAAGEARIEQAQAALDVLKEHDRQARESAAQQGDVTARQPTAEHGPAVESNPAGEMQAKIREAYNSLSVKKQEWVRVSRLRALLGGDRDEQDKALIALMRTGTCTLAPDSNRKVLTAADHEAAIRIGTEMKHLIVFDDEDPIPEAPARDIGTGVRTESTSSEVRADRVAPRVEHAATGGDVTAQQHDNGHLTVVNTNHGGNVGVQAGVVTGGVVIGHSTGPVHTGNGVQITGGTWGTVSSDPNTWHSAETQEARAERQHAREQRHQARQERHRAREERRAAQTGDVTDNGDISGGVHMGSTSRDNNVRFGDISNNTGVVMGSNTGGIYVGGSTSTGHADPADDAERAATKAAKKAKKAKKKPKKDRASSGAGDLIIGHQVGGVVQGNGYTIVGGNVYRHPGRQVSVRGNLVTDATTGQPLTPTHTVANPAAGHSVAYRDGVLHVNGVRID